MTTPLENTCAAIVGALRARYRHGTYKSIADGTGLSLVYIRGLMIGRDKCAGLSLSSLYKLFPAAEIALNEPLAPEDGASERPRAFRAMLANAGEIGAIAQGNSAGGDLTISQGAQGASPHTEAEALRARIATAVSALDCIPPESYKPLMNAILKTP